VDAQVARLKAKGTSHRRKRDSCPGISRSDRRATGEEKRRGRGIERLDGQMQAMTLGRSLRENIEASPACEDKRATSRMISIDSAPALRCVCLASC